jgi:hypothetical protein
MDQKSESEAFNEQLHAIDELESKAQGYLDRTNLKPPPHLALPSAHWRETGPKLSVAEPGELRCEARAIEYVQPVLSHGLSLVMRNPESCIRPRGHDGWHASRVVQHAFRKSILKALAWESPQASPKAVLLSPDFNASAPLWPESAATNAMLSASLLGDLIAWQHDFDASYDWESGWCTEEAKSRWASTSHGLVDRLKEALAGKAELTVNLWPLGAPEQHYPDT